jgi:hypothetical protein
VAPLGDWVRRIDYLLHRAARDAELAEEMAAHREAMHAPSRFGNTLRLRENARDVWGLGPLDDAWRDLRLAARGLRRSRGFALIAIVSLTLGLTIAAVTISVVNAYLIQDVPYPDARRLYHVMYAPPGPWEPGGLSAMDWAALNDVVEFPVATSQATLYLTEGSYAQPVRGMRVNRGFMSALGVRAHLDARSTTRISHRPGRLRSSSATRSGENVFSWIAASSVERFARRRRGGTPVARRFASSACFLRVSGSAARVVSLWVRSCHSPYPRARTWCDCVTACRLRLPNSGSHKPLALLRPR